MVVSFFFISSVFSSELHMRAQGPYSVHIEDPKHWRAFTLKGTGLCGSGIWSGHTPLQVFWALLEEILMQTGGITGNVLGCCWEELKDVVVKQVMLGLALSHPDPDLEMWMDGILWKLNITRLLLDIWYCAVCKSRLKTHLFSVGYLLVSLAG